MNSVWSFRRTWRLLDQNLAEFEQINLDIVFTALAKSKIINPDLLPIYIYDNPYTNDCEKIVTIDLHLQEIKINCRTIVLMRLREKLVPTNSSA